MPCASPCKNCDRQGLPILFTRYAAAYSAQAQGMAALEPLGPTGHLQARPGGVAMKTALYNLRMLRAGYLYVHIERDAAICADDEWKGYAVHPHGYLSEFPVNLPDQARAQPACEVEIRGANASLVWVRDAGRVKKLWYMFHSDLLDYEHLKSKIETQPAQYMQSFDVAGWARGNLAQENTTQPGQLNGQVVEFSALTSAAVRNAMEPQMYGLMGSNAQERAWGDYEEPVEETRWSADALGNPVPEKVRLVVARKGHTYQSAHGARLRKMAEYLQGRKGAVVACEDAIGIAQELGHLQAEVLSTFTYWQGLQARDFAPGVSNEWVFQTCLGGQSVMDLLKKGAIDMTETLIKDWNEGRVSAPVIYPDAATRDRELMRRTDAITRNQASERQSAAKIGDDEFKKYFDAAAAKPINTERKTKYDQALGDMADLGADQVLWLRSRRMQSAMDRYCADDRKVQQPGGGAALSLQLVQSMAGTESNAAGQKWLAGLNIDHGNTLGRAICFNSSAYLAELKQALDQAAATPHPGADPQTRLADRLSDMLKTAGGRFGLGDKALAFMDAAPAISDSGKARKLAWAGHIATLMTVRSMRAVNGLPLPNLEVAFIRSLALTGITTLGSTAQKQADALRLEARAIEAERSRLRNAANRLESVARKTSRETLMAEGARNARNSRAALLGAALDVLAAVVKGSQFGNKLDVRSGAELVQQTLQGVGNLLDLRAKAYEEAIFKGIGGAKYYNQEAMRVSFDSLKSAQLAVLRKVAFKVLVPAAVISAMLDAMDAWRSIQRDDRFLAVSQIASVVGTTFAIAGIGVAAFDIALFGISSSTLAATLGLIGAFLTLGTIVVIGGIAWLGFSGLKKEPWVDWLKDGPLSTKRGIAKPPIHENLGDTMQSLSNAKAAL